MDRSSVATAAVPTVQGPSFWEAATPDLQPRLGDVGTIEGGVFRWLDRLVAKDIPFVETLPLRLGDIEHATPGRVTLREKAAGAAPLPRSVIGRDEAGVVVELSAPGARYLQAWGCTIRRIADLDALGRVVCERYRAGRWPKGHVVVTEVVTAASAAALIAGRYGGRIELAAAGRPPRRTRWLSDPGVSVVYARGVEVAREADPGPTTLYSAAGLRSAFRDAEDEGNVVRLGDPSERRAVLAFVPIPPEAPAIA